MNLVRNGITRLAAGIAGGPSMIVRLGLTVSALSFSIPVQAVGFLSATLEDDGRRLVIAQTDGTRSDAPSAAPLDTGDRQDTFASPQIAPDGRHTGWLALYPNQGASYSQPLYLVIMDRSKQIRLFRSDSGWVYAWCFTKTADAVVFRSSFSHGPPSDRFEMRRLSDGKLLRHWLDRSASGRTAPADALEPGAPMWTRCARDSGD